MLVRSALLSNSGGSEVAPRVFGGNPVRFGSRRPHQWNHGAICEGANSAAIDDLGPPNRSIRQFGEGQRSATAKGKAEQD
jgi:hypothetical protein